MNTPIKVISIQQPWATLITLGEKKFETRSWATKHRGLLAIHASRKIDRGACRRQPIAETLNKHGIFSMEDLPTGMIIATCRLRDCLEIGTDGINVAIFAGDFCSGHIVVKEKEYCFGDYAIGRRAWELVDVEMLTDPIIAKGQLGLWTYRGVEPRAR